MIGRITGLLLEKIPPLVLVDVRGVGYEIDVPMSTFYNLPAIGTEIVLHTHLVVREDVHLLFGFATEAERSVFRQLVKISGVGARTALALLSGLSVADLHQAVAAQDSGRLIKIPGVGLAPARMAHQRRQEGCVWKAAAATCLMPCCLWGIMTARSIGPLDSYRWSLRWLTAYGRH
jgi:Holliday junction DNA helicase RuvA subunit